MNYILCIFDLDGTLIDTRQDITVAVNEVLSHYGLAEKDAKEVTGYVGDGIRKLVERCIPRSIDIEEAVSLFKHSYSNHLLDTTRPYPGVMEMLVRLDGISKALLTNKSYDLSKKITDDLGLTDYFKIIVGGDTLERKKPFPDGVDYIIKNTGQNREGTIMIGDGRNDIITAIEAGISSVYASYGFTNTDKIAGLQPTYTIHEPIELVEILGQ